MLQSSHALGLAMRLAASSAAAASSHQAPLAGFMGLRWLPQAFSTASAAAVPSRGSGDVPPGHLSSDLSPTACNIGLGRRRDLTLRQDLCLYQQNGAKTSLVDVLRGKKIILVGFPGGSVCTDKHLPSYLKMSDKLHKHGVDKVVAVTVDTPENVKEMATKNGLHGTKVEVLADKNGGLMRLLGVEIGTPDSTTEPRCHRFAAIVEDGILLKLRVENSPGELQVSDCQSMLKLWDCVYPKA